MGTREQGAGDDLAPTRSGRTARAVSVRVGVLTRQERAIAAANLARRAELLPVRLQVAEVIESIGWRSARPVIEEVLGVHAAGPHGGWWSKVGKRNGKALLLALAEKSQHGQLCLPEVD